MSITRGKKLMLFIETSSNVFKSVGYATSHTLSTSASTLSVSHKDLADAGSGKWDSQDIDTLSWTITTENFYAATADGVTFADLFGYYSGGTELNVKFAVAADSTTGVPQNGWVPPSTGYILSGKCVITSLDLNAPVDDNASFSCTLTGRGPLTGATAV